MSEISHAISVLKRGKAPGPDGFTIEFYVHFAALLLPKLLLLYDSFITDGSSSGTFQEAMICLIPKENKDPSQCKNYRPISLVNLDYKSFAKIVALRIDPILPHLIGPEQSGFVKGRLASDNSRVFFIILSKASSLDHPIAAIALDAEKAFDRIGWEFMFQALQWIGFPQKFIYFISLLYSGPKASIFINGKISNYFPLFRGVR